MHVVVLAQQVLGLLESPYQSTRPPVAPGNRLQEIPESLERNSGPMRLLGVVRPADPHEVVAQLNNLPPGQFAGHLPERREPLTLTGLQLDPEHAECPTELAAGLPVT